jgi:uncharacterized RDD family membrane protein YckC
MDMQDANELEYVGFWTRFLAFIVDSILFSILLAPFTPDIVITGGPPYDLHSIGVAYAGQSSSVLLLAVVTIVFWKFRSATPGKMLIGARIVDARTGGAPSLSQDTIRYLGYFLSVLGLCLGFVWIGIDPRKQGWHDKLAGTVVVRSKKRGAEPVKFEQQQN